MAAAAKLKAVFIGKNREESFGKKKKKNSTKPPYTHFMEYLRSTDASLRSFHFLNFARAKLKKRLFF